MTNTMMYPTIINGLMIRRRAMILRIKMKSWKILIKVEILIITQVEILMLIEVVVARGIKGRNTENRGTRRNVTSQEQKKGGKMTKEVVIEEATIEGVIWEDPNQDSLNAVTTAQQKSANEIFFSSEANRRNNKWKEKQSMYRWTKTARSTSTIARTTIREVRTTPLVRRSIERRIDFRNIYTNIIID